MQRLRAKAQRLAETLINGNISDCIDGIAEETGPIKAASLALLIRDKLPTNANLQTFYLAIDRRIGD